MNDLEEYLEKKIEMKIHQKKIERELFHPPNKSGVEIDIIPDIISIKLNFDRHDIIYTMGAVFVGALIGLHIGIIQYLIETP